MDERARQLSAIAARLLEVPAVELTALNGGANAAVFKVTAGDQTAVLKAYPEIAGDGRDRRRTEWQALQFLGDAGVTAVPRPLATDEASNLSLLSWCAGGPVTVVTDDHIDRAADFIA
ncbi:MAG: phosphotransferase, partial [Pseudomonadota bacterium]|nr:phosphotransferase [Pseudomonadota bacterium]